MLAFGFVYAHPFEDGNGRVHRYRIHHILSRRGFNPPELVFPVSVAILERIENYLVLEGYSRRLLPCIEWAATVRSGRGATSVRAISLRSTFTAPGDFPARAVLR
jgi:Fic family protein